MLLASSGWRPGLLLNIPRSIGQPRPPQKILCRVGSPRLVRPFGVAVRLPLGHNGVFVKMSGGEWHNHREVVSERKQSHRESQQSLAKNLGLQVRAGDTGSKFLVLVCESHCDRPWSFCNGPGNSKAVPQTGRIWLCCGEEKGSDLETNDRG